VDEERRPIQRKVEVAGIFGLHSYRPIDDAISDALNLPRGPED
jgi:hypothetical protein